MTTDEPCNPGQYDDDGSQQCQTHHNVYRVLDKTETLYGSTPKAIIAIMSKPCLQEPKPVRVQGPERNLPQHQPRWIITEDAGEQAQKPIKKLQYPPRALCVQLYREPFMWEHHCQLGRRNGAWYKEGDATEQPVSEAGRYSLWPRLRN